MAKKLLPKLVLRKSHEQNLKRIMADPLDRAVAYVGLGIQAVQSGEYMRGAGFAFAAAIVAGRHYAKRPDESMKVAALADVLLFHAASRQNIPGAAAATVGILGARRPAAAQSLISNKIRTLMREGYPPKQAQAIAYNMARRRASSVGSGEPAEVGRLSRTMALVKMLESV